MMNAILALTLVTIYVQPVPILTLTCACIDGYSGNGVICNGKTQILDYFLRLFALF